MKTPRRPCPRLLPRRLPRLGGEEAPRVQVLASWTMVLLDGQRVEVLELERVRGIPRLGRRGDPAAVAACSASRSAARSSLGVFAHAFIVAVDPAHARCWHPRTAVDTLTGWTPPRARAAAARTRPPATRKRRRRCPDAEPRRRPSARRLEQHARMDPATAPDRHHRSSPPTRRSASSDVCSTCCLAGRRPVPLVRPRAGRNWLERRGRRRGMAARCPARLGLLALVGSPSWSCSSSTRCRS